MVNFIKKHSSLICYSIIVFVSVFDIVYGIHFENKQYRFKKNAIKTEAEIYSIVTRDDKKKVLYVSFLVDNKAYDGVLVTDYQSITTSDRVYIYYDPKNPTHFTDGVISKNGYFLILLGIIFFLVGFTKLVFLDINSNKNKLKMHN